MFQEACPYHSVCQEVDGPFFVVIFFNNIYFLAFFQRPSCNNLRIQFNVIIFAKCFQCRRDGERSLYSWTINIFFWGDCFNKEGKMTLFYSWYFSVSGDNYLPRRTTVRDKNRSTGTQHWVSHPYLWEARLFVWGSRRVGYQAFLLLPSQVEFSRGGEECSDTLGPRRSLPSLGTAELALNMQLLQLNYHGSSYSLMACVSEQIRTRDLPSRHINSG